MTKARLSLAWQILIGLVLGIAIGALLNHFSAEKAWWIANVLQPAGDIFIRMIKMIVIPIVIASLVVGIAGYVLKKCNYPLAPLVLATVLGDKAEEAFRQSLLVSQGSFGIFFSNGLVSTIMGLGILAVVWPAVSQIKGRLLAPAVR